MKFKITMASIVMAVILSITVSAQSGVHTVGKGDTMWKIAVRYEIGLSELIEANPQIKYPALIYPGEKVYIPNIDDVKELERKVANLVNAERAKNGLAPLTFNWELSRVARYKSEDMVNKNYFDHYSPTYGTPFEMIKSFGIKYMAAGENIAKGQPSPESVMNAWMSSPGHRSNILNSNYNQIGVGVAKDSKGNLTWTQIFTKA